MSAMRLTIRPAPEIGAGVRFFELDCEHGTTTAFTDGPPAFPDPEIVGFLLATHDEREGCRCTGELRQRYGPPRSLPNLRPIAQTTPGLVGE